jgi:hypothetical protein
MPGSMDGIALARVVRNRWPKVGVIITSGKTLPWYDDVLPGPLLPKPYTQKQLVGLLEAFA